MGVKEFWKKMSHLQKIAFVLIVLIIVAIIVTWDIPIKPYPLMKASPYKLCDNDRDGDCDKTDYKLVTQAIGSCENRGNYNELADADHDGCVTESDREQLFPIIPEEQKIVESLPYEKKEEIKLTPEELEKAKTIELTEECKKISETYVKSKCYSDLARELKDIYLCNEIGDYELRENCASEFIASLTSVEECEKTGGFRALCYTSFAKKLNDPEICHKIPLEADKSFCLLEFIIELEECNALEESYSQSKCYHRFAVKIRDISLCDKIKDENLKSNCIEHVNQLISCETKEGEVEGQSLRSRCYYSAAIGWEDLSLCNKIEDESNLKSKCIDIVKSAEECKTKGEVCYYNAALNFNVVGLCDKIIDDWDLKNRCIAEVEEN